jgi:HAD superfamily hydrolase (TIGR01450 family)
MNTDERRLKNIRHFALDLDGTLYLGGKLFEATIPFLNLLQQRGIGRTFFTNNSSRSTRQYVQKLNHLGIPATTEDVYSSTCATLDYLRDERPDVKRIYLVGTRGLAEEFAENGFALCEDDSSAEPDAVIVGFDPAMNFERACKAAWWIKRGKLFIATHCDLTCPTDQPTVWIDCGSVCRMLTAATGREPDAVLGKPNPRMVSGAMRRHHVTPDQLAVVGDRLYTDIAMSRAAGALGILVLSGETTAEQASQASPKPDLILNGIGDLSAML